MARGHWHVLATLSAVILLLLIIDVLDIRGAARKIMAWLLFTGSVIAFGFAVFYLYVPHLDQVWAANSTLYTDVKEYWATNAFLLLPPGFLPLVMDLGILFITLALITFCFHQLIEILKGRKDIKEWPE